MNLSDRKKIVAWLDKQISKLEAMPNYEEIKDNVEKLKKTKKEQEYFISAAERNKRNLLPDMRKTF